MLPFARTFCRCASWLMAGTVALSAVGQTTSAGANATPPAEVRGEVINAVTGSPVARALVRFNSRAALTDHDGHFAFPQNTDTTGNFMVVKPGFTASSDPLDSQNIFVQGDQLGGTIRLLLYPEAVLTGTVTSRDGLPLQGIQVIATRSVYDEAGSRQVPSGFTGTDTHGNFRMPVPAGSYRLSTVSAARDRYSGLSVLPATVPEKTSSNASENIRIHSGEELHFDLRPVTGVPHTVTASSDALPQRGMGFMRITATTTGGETMQLNALSSGSRGEIKMELPQGRYTLVARNGGPGAVSQAEAAVTVPDHDISGVVFRFAQVPAIPVEIQVDEDSIADAAQVPSSASQLSLTLQNDQQDLLVNDSTIRLTSLGGQTYGFVASPGSYRVLARGSGNWYVKSVAAGTSDLLQDGLTVAAGSSGMTIRVTLSDQMGSVQGGVKLNGTPCACWVYLVATRPSAQPVISMRSNADGGYSNSRVPPGSYRVVAFERRHSFNYADPASLSAFAAHVGSVTVTAAEKASLDLDAIPAAELIP